MRFFLDENTPVNVATYLRTIFRNKHEFAHPCLDDPDNLRGLNDVELFARLSGLSFDCVLTNDLKQATRRDELQALYDSGLSWIGMKPTGNALEMINGLCGGFMLAVADFVRDTPEESTLITANKPNTPSASKRKLMRDELSKQRNWKAPQNRKN